MVRAKMSVFVVNPGRCMVWPKDGGPGYEAPCETVKLWAVSGGPGNENAEWNLNTPTAHVEIVIANPEAMGKFVLGKSYYVDFTPAE